MADGTTVQMCRDPDGKWVTQPLAGSTGSPQRVEASYQGTYSAVLSEEPKLNFRNLGSLLNSAMNQNSRPFGGQIQIALTITGNQARARVTGTNIYAIDLAGSVTNGRCLLKGASSYGTGEYSGSCGPTGFSGTFSGQMSRGRTYKGQFETSAVQYVDLDEKARRDAAAAAERERLAAVQRAENERLQREAAARLAAMPNAGPALTKRLDGFVATDSAGWAFNRYDAGSMRNVKIVEGSLKSGAYTMRGEYTYNGGASGWVFARMAGGQLQCIQFWDAMIGCRALRTPAQGQAMRNAAFDAFTGSGSGSSSSSSYADDALDSIRQNNEERARQEANQPPPPPPPPPIGGDRGLYGADHSCC